VVHTSSRSMTLDDPAIRRVFNFDTRRTWHITNSHISKGALPLFENASPASPLDNAASPSSLSLPSLSLPLSPSCGLQAWCLYSLWCRPSCSSSSLLPAPAPRAPMVWASPVLRRQAWRGSGLGDKAGLGSPDHGADQGPKWPLGQPEEINLTLHLHAFP
jgi:hypothetical protein